ncbi:MAG: hypothetical protein LBN22_07470 [Clostridiales Family XIII bacterium]|nr:hypothetical protein [Clostridiales Family XIII bacterium]
MNHSITRKVTDHSTASTFSFSYYCDICGKEWRSWVEEFESEPFCSNIDNDEIRSLVWNDAHKTALRQITLEAMLHFNKCPVCSRWVCDDCFYPDLNDGMGICKACLEEESK